MQKLKEIYMRLVEWIKKLFKKKPVDTTLVVSWVKTLAPDGGTHQLEPFKIPVSKGVKIEATSSKAPNFMNVIVSSFVNGQYVTGLQPSVDLSGKTSGVLDISNLQYGENTELLAYVGYPAALNTETVDVTITVTLQRL
jgi:hypothetical protein